MFSPVSAVLLLAAAASPAFGTLFITQPVASSKWSAGQQQTISWQDDGQAPSLAEFGDAVVSIYVGSEKSQTSLQTIVDNVNVASTSSIAFTPDASIGEDGAYYFIRIDSKNAKSPQNPAYPAQGFSAKFALTGMTGTFDATVKQQIGAAVGSSGSSAAATTSATGTASSAAGSKAATSSSHAPSSSTSAKAQENNGARAVSGSAVACLAGAAAVALSMLL
ncbi:hypothetical protein BD413DRAFT_543492 [Trametes elegans]|nr:hypothetical protein BD413DRAFT_543492 [Trametes elegans]